MLIAEVKLHINIVHFASDGCLIDVESVQAQAERLFASFSNFYYKLQYKIRLHLLLKPHYDSQFREFAHGNRRLFLDVANRLVK